MMKNRLYLSLVVVVVLLCLAVWTRQGQGGSSTRQTWAYKVVYLGIVVETQSGSFAKVEKALNQGGADGWELVLVETTGEGTTAYFKRPK